MKKLLSQLLAVIGLGLAFFIGRISWSSPPWLQSLQRKAHEQPRLFWRTTGSLLILLLIIGFGYHWYSHRPRPVLVTALITPPQITPVAKTLVPDVLTVDFGLNTGEFSPQSVAPLNLIGKEVVSGITLTPAIAGKWLWQSDSRLVFRPTEDWPAGQQYTIHFDHNVFTSGKKMESYHYSFSTHAFEATIAEFKFYQDPVNPQLRQAVATINFNFPVDSDSFENKTTLILEALKQSLNVRTQSFKYTVSYDEHKRTAYLHSEPLPLPEMPRYLLLTIDKGVKSASGTASTSESITKNVLIPDAGSFLKINKASAAIIRNDQDRPEQVLTLETTIGVTETELNKALHVYLLPQDYPASATQPVQTNYAWQNPGEVTPDIVKLATPVALTTIPADRDYATLHSYKFTAPTPRYFYLKIDKGVKGFGDYVLTNDYMAVIKVPEFPQEIGFLHKGALLALSSEKKLSVIVRGLPAVKFTIARVLPDNVNQLITQTSGNFNDPQFFNESFNQNNISEIFSEIQPFNAHEPAKAQYSALDLGKYLAAKTNPAGPLGLFLLQATGWDPVKKAMIDVKASRLILITDLGLLVKDNQDGTHDVYVQSITRGAPVTNAHVSILGKNGLPLLTRDTDAQGHVNFPTLKDFTDEREPTVYIASLANDVAFIPYSGSDRQLNYSRYDVGGLYTNNQENSTLTAYLFSDRGIYRPGDTTHIGVIVKQAYAQPQPAGLPLEATVTDPRGVTVKDIKYTLDATGYLSFDFKTDVTSPTGQYNINLYIVKDNHASNLLGSTTIRVAEFQPDRMRIKAQFSQPATLGWVSPVGLTAKVGLWNLYGAPAANRKVSARILLAPQTVYFEKYPNYNFIDPLFDPNKPPKVFTDTLPDTVTDAQGQAQFDLNLERFDKASYHLTFFAEGFESEGGRSVATETSILVSPLSFFVGYKPDSDLRFIKQNSQHSVSFIAINPQLTQQAVGNLKIQLANLHPVSTLVKNPDGTYQYQSLIQTTVINTTAFNIDANGTNYSLPTQQIGDFELTILDQNNTEISRLKYSVVGTSQLPLPKNAELSVKLSKAEFLPNEDIELQITAPYTGAGLITIERDKVYATQWFKTNTTSSVQKIHIPKDFQGNGYVNVSFVRDWDSPEIFVSPLSYSVVPFKVNHDNHAIHITLNTPDLARPGEPFNIQYQSDKPGKIIVFAVDEGILQVAGYSTPDPLSFFFQKHALEVLTQQTLDQILPKFVQDRELSAAGGDHGLAMLHNQLNPFKRKTELPVVYWSGIIDTDNTPRQLTYNVPDYFNGTLHVMAVAVAADAVGAADKKSEVRGDFVINPNVPTFVAPGDEFEITASIANNAKGSGNGAKVNVQLSTTSQLEIIGDSNQTIAINEGQENTVRYKLKAKNLLGAAEINFVATLADKSSKMSATLSVRPASNFTTSLTSGSNSDASKSVSLDRVLYPEYRDVQAAMSNSPLILVFGLQQYLANYPYGCTEQLVSEAFPLLVMAKQPWFTTDTNVINNKVQTVIQMLEQRQMSGGAISYWPGVGMNESNTFASVYAMHFLTEAREQGINIPNDLLANGIAYLKELAAQNATSLEQARVQAYAIYVLTRNEIVTTNYLTNLQIYLDQDRDHLWQQDITSVYLAATYQLLKSATDANRLISYYKPLQNKNNIMTNFYDSTIGDAEYLYIIARHFPERLANTGSNLVLPLVTALNDSEINTLLSSYTSLALGAYAQTLQLNNNATYSISEIVNGQQKTLAAADSTYQKVSVDQLTTKITFNNPAKQIYYYQLSQAGFDKNPDTSVVKQGLEISREYRDVQGNVITKTNLGSDIEVHIQIRAINHDYLNNIAIVDLLPGGFEVVRDSVNTSNMDYVDIREDRVIFFGGVSSDAKELVYRIQAINAGQFIVPPIYATSMYNPNIQAHGTAGSISIVGLNLSTQ